MTKIRIDASDDAEINCTIHNFTGCLQRTGNYDNLDNGWYV